MLNEFEPRRKIGTSTRLHSSASQGPNSMDDESSPHTLPKPFVWRRLHSLTGLFLVLYLFLHLLTNSQAALFIGDDGEGFITDVNRIHTLPYLPLIELFLLGVPFAIHIWSGIYYLLTAEPNSGTSDGTVPSLPQYGRNHAYTWQRITSWFLLVAIVAHVVHMRFIKAPKETKLGHQQEYLTRLESDPGLYTVATRLGAILLDEKQVDQLRSQLEQEEPSLIALRSKPSSELSIDERLLLQERSQQEQFVTVLEAEALQPGQLVALADNFAVPTLLMLRETFQSIPYALLYTLFVLAASFHSCNGLWTALISWGVTLNRRIQWLSLCFCWGAMALLMFMGLASIWATYWINLRS